MNSTVLELHIVESALSTRQYHLSTTGKSGRTALCGRHNVMCTALQLNTWNTQSQLHESYCEECASIAKKLGFALS